MRLFRTKSGEIINIEDISKIIKHHQQGNYDWVYAIVTKNILPYKDIQYNEYNPSYLLIDPEEYKYLIEYIYKSDSDKYCGWWPTYLVEKSKSKRKYNKATNPKDMII